MKPALLGKHFLSFPGENKIALPTTSDTPLNVRNKPIFIL